MNSVFDRVRLNSNQARAVADRRLADAECLRKTRRNRHANGAMYLGGVALECALKAKLLEEQPWLQHFAGRVGDRPSAERELYLLCYKYHDLAGLLERLSEELRQKLDNAQVLERLKKLCGEWTIHVRYSPKTADRSQAARFLSDVKELMRWLR